MAFQTGVNVWGAAADQAAGRYGLDPALFRAVITQESGWNPNARSGAGAIGLTQVVPRWHPDANLTTPQSQLDYGAKYLSSLMRQYKGSRRDALSAYNSGRPWSVGQGIGETRNYVNTILSHVGQQPGATAPTAGQSTVPAQVAATGGLQVNPQSIADLKAYMAASEKAIMGGGQSPDASPYLNRIASRYGQSAPPAVGKQVAGDALQNLGTTALPQGLGGTAVTAAQKELGVPYAWGGGGPGGPSRGFAQGAGTVGFDCSSLAQWAWAKAGVQLPRTTYDQIKVGRAIPSVAQARPGDLMFPSTGHVQIYIGNGKVIEAPHTGGHVQIVSARPSYIAIRRPA